MQLCGAKTIFLNETDICYLFIIQVYCAHHILSTAGDTLTQHKIDLHDFTRTLHIVMDVMVVKLFPSIRLVIHPVQLKVFCDSPSSCCSSNLLLLGNENSSSFALHFKKAKKDFSQHFFFSLEALAFYLEVFDLSIMHLIIFIFKQESSKKRFIFFSIYPLISFLRGLAKCVKGRKASCRPRNPATQFYLLYD